jgi:hypothetical protein
VKVTCYSSWKYKVINDLNLDSKLLKSEQFCIPVANHWDKELHLNSAEHIVLVMWADIERSIAKLSDILYKPRVVTNRLFPDISLVQNVCITIKYIDHCACHNYFHVGNIMICHRDTKLFWFKKFTVKVKHTLRLSFSVYLQHVYVIENTLRLSFSVYLQHVYVIETCCK